MSFIIAALVGALAHYCTVRKKCDCQKFYSLTIARKQQKQQPAPVYDDIVGQSQNIELKENVAYGPVQQWIYRLEFSQVNLMSDMYTYNRTVFHYSYTAWKANVAYGLVQH